MKDSKSPVRQLEILTSAKIFQFFRFKHEEFLHRSLLFHWMWVLICSKESMLSLDWRYMKYLKRLTSSFTIAFCLHHSGGDRLQKVFLLRLQLFLSRNLLWRTFPRCLQVHITLSLDCVLTSPFYHISIVTIQTTGKFRVHLYDKVNFFCNIFFLYTRFP